MWIVVVGGLGAFVLMMGTAHLLDAHRERQVQRRLFGPPVHQTTEHRCDPPAMHPWTLNPRWLCTGCMTAYHAEWEHIMGRTVRWWVPTGRLEGVLRWQCPECGHGLIPCYRRTWWGRKVIYRRCVSCAYALVAR